MLQPQHAIRAINNGPMLSRKSISVGFVAGLHVLAIWTLIHAIIPHALPTVGELTAVPIKEKKQVEPLPLPKPPEATPVVTTVEPPTFDVDTGPRPDTGTGITLNTSIAPPVRPNAIPDRGPLALSIGQKPPYPAIAARMHREGAVTLKLVISETGKVTSALLVKSSGHSELDQAALEWAVSWKYKPALKDGKPVASTTEETVDFNLKDAG